MSRLISPAVMLLMDQIRLTISVEGHLVTAFILLFF